MKVRSVIPMRIAKTGYIVISVVLLSLGILFIILPDISMRTIGKMLGAVMVLFGCIKLTGYFSKDLFRLAFQYDLQFGILVWLWGLLFFSSHRMQSACCCGYGHSFAGRQSFQNSDCI